MHIFVQAYLTFVGISAPVDFNLYSISVWLRLERGLINSGTLWGVGERMSFFSGELYNAQHHFPTQHKRRVRKSISQARKMFRIEVLNQSNLAAFFLYRFPSVHIKSLKATTGGTNYKTLQIVSEVAIFR